MKKMTLDEIKTSTLSVEITTPNVVYKVLQNTIARNFKKLMTLHLLKGDLICISGCGKLNDFGYSQFLINGEWYQVANYCVEHYANEILSEAD